MHLQNEKLNLDVHVYYHWCRIAKKDDEHICNRLENLQRDLKRILQARGTMENFQNLLREKGINISNDVIKKITKYKSETISQS
jgi:hypothetical protein